ncbi:MAG: aminotransferase class I/II-fold pyridoxal phosphate-dependent enzyme [Cyclobacteriaceae bacterium]|nr:aminotransferase class I/II-fold pyridoxal phosphate-dependent enzyme [Cyclobacteriaceae bacterium]
MIRIPLSFNPINTRALAAVLQQYENKHHNLIIDNCEYQFARVVGVDHAVAVNSGTAAIHLALLVAGVEPGDLVMAPTFTYIATLNPIRYLQATPVLLDIEPQTWNLDPGLLEQALHKYAHAGHLPKALIVVHTYGTPALISEIINIANRYGVIVIEDAAESLGASFEGKSVGTFGHLGVFSFNNNKTITGFGGGMLVTGNQDMAKRARFLATQAREDYPYYQHQTVGYNYSINPLAAAYLLSQMPDLEVFVQKRRHIYQVYRELLFQEIISQEERTGVRSARWLSAFLLPKGNNVIKTIATLLKEGIETRPAWNPMHRQPLYQNSAVFLNRNADEYFNRGLCLPSGTGITEAMQHEVVARLKRLL